MPTSRNSSTPSVMRAIPKPEGPMSTPRMRSHTTSGILFLVAAEARGARTAAAAMTKREVKSAAVDDEIVNTELIVPAMRSTQSL